MLEGAVERVEHAAEARGDGLANRGAHDRKQRIGQRLRILADGGGDGFFDRRRERTGQLRIVLTEENGLGQYGADIARHPAGITDPGLQRTQLALFRPDDQRPQLREFGRRLRAAARPCNGAGGPIRHSAPPRRPAT